LEPGAKFVLALADRGFYMIEVKLREIKVREIDDDTITITRITAPSISSYLISRSMFAAVESY